MILFTCELPLNILLILQTLGTLVHVGMPQNGIHHEGICALAKSFSKNPKMQVRKNSTIVTTHWEVVYEVWE